MGKEYTEIDERVQRWIDRQHMFFVATAPLEGDGLINCSPKGLNSFAVLGPRQIAYADVGGSGIETVAHVKQNGRITVMMCSFEGPPKIFRFYGEGRSLEAHEDGFAELASRFEGLPTIRNIVVVDVDRIIDSCGYGVPLYEYQGERDSLDNYFADKTEQDVHDYHRENNATSLDGLPGLDVDQIPGASS